MLVTPILILVVLLVIFYSPLTFLPFLIPLCHFIMILSSITLGYEVGPGAISGDLQRWSELYIN